MALNTAVFTGADSLAITKDTLTRNLKNFAQGAIAQVTFNNDIANSDVAKDGGIVSPDVRGGLAELTVRLLAGSDDDNFFLNEIASYRQNSSGYIMLGATFIKNFGDGRGNVSKRTYTLNGGAVSRIPQFTTDVNGDVEQAINVYLIRFIDSTISTN